MYYTYLISYKEYGCSDTWIERDFITLEFELKTKKDIYRLEERLALENNPDHTFCVLSVYLLEKE